MSNENFLILLKQIIDYFYPIVILIGLVGNLLSFLIFLQKKFEKTPDSIYFCLLAIFDIFSNFIALNHFLAFQFNIYLNRTSDIFCKLNHFINYFSTAVSAWLKVLISFDRLFSVIKPTKFLFRKRRKFQCTFCLFILIANLVARISLLS